MGGVDQLYQFRSYYNVVPCHRVVAYSSKRCVYCQDVLKCVQRISYGCDVCRVSLC